MRHKIKEYYYGGAVVMPKPSVINLADTLGLHLYNSYITSIIGRVQKARINQY